MNKNTHVYCAECEYGERLLHEIMNAGNTIVPKECEGCYPWNWEDSCSIEDRPNFVYKERLY
jgi:hypothetical protein